MTNERASGRVALWFTLLAAVLLQVMPLPQALQSWRPEWVLLAVVYWVLTLPHRFNILSACTIGIVLDVLLGGTLGVRGLGLAIVAFLVAVQYQKLRHFTMIHQTLLVGFYASIAQMLIYLVEYLNNSAVSINLTYLQPTILTALLWPWAVWLLGRIRRRFKIR